MLQYCSFAGCLSPSPSLLLPHSPGPRSLPPSTLSLPWGCLNLDTNWCPPNWAADWLRAHARLLTQAAFVVEVAAVFAVWHCAICLLWCGVARCVACGEGLGSLRLGLIFSVIPRCHRTEPLLPFRCCCALRTPFALDACVHLFSPHWPLRPRGRCPLPLLFLRRCYLRCSAFRCSGPVMVQQDRGGRRSRRRSRELRCAQSACSGYEHRV